MATRELTSLEKDIHSNIMEKITITDQSIEVSLKMIVGEQESERMEVGAARSMRFEGNLTVDEKDYLRRRLFESVAVDVVDNALFASNQFNRIIAKWPRHPDFPAEPAHGKVSLEDIEKE